jgi:hypothetical protein
VKGIAIDLLGCSPGVLGETVFPGSLAVLPMRGLLASQCPAKVDYERVNVPENPLGVSKAPTAPAKIYRICGII